MVHETAGIAALIIAVFLGPRKNHTTPPHNPGFVMIGAAMLWVGWFGFNGGSQLAADGGAAMALTVTHISAATASLTWALWEKVKFGKHRWSVWSPERLRDLRQSHPRQVLSALSRH